MTGVVARTLKSAGLLPALGGIIVHLVDAEFLKKFDPLQGYGGSAPNFWALGLCAIGWFAAVRAKVRWPATANLTQTVSSLLALGLFVITLMLVLVPLPEAYTSLGDARWRIALFTYLAFYLALGVAFA